jgi:hypothetical protein
VKKINILIIVILLFSILFSFGYFGITNNSECPHKLKCHSIKLEITGFAESVAISFDCGCNCHFYSIEGSSLPWIRYYEEVEEGAYFCVTAKNNGDYGHIKTTFTVDDILIKSDENYSSYGQVSAGGYI